MKLVTSLLVCISISTSCEMMDNAKKAADNSNRAADNSDILKDLSATLYMSAVSGGSEDSRREALKMMAEAQSFDLKARYAASFIKAQTYQLINPMLKNISVGDFYRFREDALLEDIPIVARAIADNMPKNQSYKVTKTKGNYGNVKAISVALHETNKLYYQFSGHANIPMQSILDVVMDALNAHYVEKKSLSELSPVQNKVLYYRREFLYALELRHKFLPIVAIAKISDLNSGITDKLGMILGSWDPQDAKNMSESKKRKKQRKKFVNDGFSSSEFELSLKMLNHSIAARDFIRTLGTNEAELPGIVQRLLSHMTLKEADKDGEQVVAELNAAVKNLLTN